ncbi:hypothetical protein TNCV_3020841 [Trichonephila clavipes]|nr:hypothetical protein TNCV_3020841 [Trichonephila clavipes]
MIDKHEEMYKQLELRKVLYHEQGHLKTLEERIFEAVGPYAKSRERNDASTEGEVLGPGPIGPRLKTSLITSLESFQRPNSKKVNSGWPIKTKTRDDRYIVV